MNKPRVIAVVGPTASGKTAFATALAQRLETEIISADSRQFYTELPIGSAMPSPEELAAVKHHFVACRSVRDEYAAGAYARDARQVLDTLLEKHGRVIVCGGSGLYIQALLHGMDDFPPVTDEARARVETLYAEKGLEGLQNALQEADPAYFAEVDRQNPARLRRALEVCFSAQRPYSSFRSHPNRPLYPYVALGMDLPKTELHARIHRRTEAMIQAGLEAEAKALLPLRHLKALQTVGYQEFFEYFDGKITHERCVEEIETHTRQYAKRQLTWFRKQLPVEWISPEENPDTVLKRF